MMTCMICGAAHEVKEIETGFTDPAKRAKAEAEAKVQADELAKWEHLRVTITRNGGQLELAAGSVCPKHNLQTGDVKVVAA